MLDNCCNGECVNQPTLLCMCTWKSNALGFDWHFQDRKVLKSSMKDSGKGKTKLFGNGKTMPQKNFKNCWGGGLLFIKVLVYVLSMHFFLSVIPFGRWELESPETISKNIL